MYRRLGYYWIVADNHISIVVGCSGGGVGGAGVLAYFPTLVAFKK